MSVILKFIQQRDEGWTWYFKTTSGPGCAIRYEDIWDNIMLSVVNTGEDYRTLCEGNQAEIKKVIEKHMIQAVESIKRELYEDLNNSVKIHPLIRKGGQDD